FVCRLLHLKIISLKKPLQIGLCNKALTICISREKKLFSLNKLNFKTDWINKSATVFVERILSAELLKFFNNSVIITCVTVLTSLGSD
ncbi:hypothetical protein EXE07_16620, partial [Acinetobacter pittii]